MSSFIITPSGLMTTRRLPSLLSSQETLINAIPWRTTSVFVIPDSREIRSKSAAVRSGSLKFSRFVRSDRLEPAAWSDGAFSVAAVPDAFCLFGVLVFMQKLCVQSYVNCTS